MSTFGSPFFFLAAAAAAYFGGQRPGLVAVGLSAIACILFVLRPEESMSRARAAGSIAMFGAVAVGIVQFVVSYHGRLLELGARTSELERQAQRDRAARDAAEAAARERSAQAAQSARLYEEAIGALHLRDEVFAVTAHELRTPLSSIRMNAQLLQRRIERGLADDPDAMRVIADRIADQSVHLARLINQLFDVSRIEAGRLTLNVQPTDLVRLATTVVDAERGIDDLRSITLEAPEELIAAADPTRIEQILINLLDNARKYSPEKTAIDVTIATRAGVVEIAVRDRGIGVAEEERGRIFDRFYQGSTGSASTGLGLGLYICRQIAQLHGGDLRVEAPGDGGSRFVLTLPFS